MNMPRPMACIKEQLCVWLAGADQPLSHTYTAPHPPAPFAMLALKPLQQHSWVAQLSRPLLRRLLFHIVRLAGSRYP